MSPSRFARIGRLGLVVVVAILAFAWSRQGLPGGSTDRFAAAMARELERQGVDSALADRVRGVGDVDSARSIGEVLGRKGIARLSPQQLNERVALLLHMDSTATKERCAARFMGTLAPAAMREMTGALDDQQLERWAQLAVAGIRLELEQEARPLAPPTQGEVAQAVDLIQRRLSRADGERFLSLVQDLSSATDEQRCWVSRTIASTTLAMPDPPQAQVLKTFGKLEAGL